MASISYAYTVSKMFLFAYIVLARAHIFFALWQGILARSAMAAHQVNCISNYAEMKQAIFQEETGNVERLLYAFTPPNQPPPHYIWVYYFHNQSSEWKDILTCPPYNVLHRCPLDHEESETHNDGGSSAIEDSSEYHAIFWGDSPMLINLDIPLLRALSYNSILQYLGNESCVEIVIPPFCAHVDSASEKEIYNFATTYLRSYSTSEEEGYRDYVLNCEDKFVVEHAYDGYLLCSEIVVCIGSTLLFSFLSLKLCSIKYDEPRRGSVNVVSLYGPPDDTNWCHIRRVCHSCKKGNCIDVDATYDRHKIYFSVVLIINIAAISFLFADAEEFYHNSEILREAFWYGYGSLYVILFVVAFIALLIEIPVFTVYFIVFCIVNFFPKRLLFGRTLRQHEICLSYSLIISTVLTIVLFIYILSRGFLVSLVLATYPLEVGAILMTIGSGFIALLFVVWVAVHIGVESYEAKAKLITTIVYLVPYGSLLIILTGFLLSYIYVILRLSIRLNDPVTSLVAACIPATVGFIAANRYKSGLTKIKKGISSKNEARKKVREQREAEVANFAAYKLSHFAINPLSAHALDDNAGETSQNKENLEGNTPADSSE